MWKLFFRTTISFLFVTSSSWSQPQSYSAANLHSHNDYDRPNPFYEAFQLGYGSIEADIFLSNGKLLVAHESTELNPRRNLEAMYLRPLQKMIRQKGDYLTAGHKYVFILLVDIKSTARPTLDSLVSILKNYPEITGSPVVKVTISGNRPPIEEWSLFPDYIYFDGLLSLTYPDSLLQRVALVSENFKKYSQWDGIGPLPSPDKQKLQEAIQRVHQLEKPVRFWYAPDTQNVWKQLMNLGVDLINTDQIEVAASFIQDLGNFR